MTQQRGAIPATRWQQLTILDTSHIGGTNLYIFTFTIIALQNKGGCTELSKKVKARAQFDLLLIRCRTFCLTLQPHPLQHSTPTNSFCWLAIVRILLFVPICTCGSSLPFSGAAVPLPHKRCNFLRNSVYLNNLLYFENSIKQRSMVSTLEISAIYGVLGYRLMQRPSHQ